MANAFINLLPLDPAQPRNVVDTYLRARQMRNQNALQERALEQEPEKTEMQNALTREQIKTSQDTNALNTIKLKEAKQMQLYKQMAPDVAAWDAKWEQALEENEGDRKAALAQIQPQWESYVPTAKEKGYPVTDTFDPESTKAFIGMLKTNKIIPRGGDSLSQTSLTDQQGNPLVYDKSTGSYRRGTVESGVQAKPRQKPTKPSQSSLNQASMFKEIQKQYPDATEGEFLLASKNAQATGNSIDRELKKIIGARSTEAKPAKTEAPKEPWYKGRFGGEKKEPVVSGPKVLDKATAQALLKEAGGDKNKARQLAKERGYKL